MGSGWENPGPAKRVIIAGPSGELLVYSGPPAAGNLILAISAVAGNDFFGNTWDAGVTIPWHVGGTYGSAGEIVFQDTTGITNRATRLLANQVLTPLPDIHLSVLGAHITGSSAIEAALIVGAGNNYSGSVIGPQHYAELRGEQIDIETYGPGKDLLTLTASNLVIPGPTIMQFSAGQPGKVYSHDWLFNKINVAANTQTQVTGIASNVHLDSDYGGSISAGVFTAPVASFYDSSMYVSNPGAGIARAIIRRNGTGIASGSSGTSGDDASCSIPRFWCAQGDTVTWFMVQRTGANATVTGEITIGRCLA